MAGSYITVFTMLSVSKHSSVPTFQNLEKQNNFEGKIVMATVLDCGSGRVYHCDTYLYSMRHFFIFHGLYHMNKVNKCKTGAGRRRISQF